ncbi:MAG: metal-dependent hydrolase [Planctomycetia bacterium]|nr:metal-dependent hydrolase [Planctomycetia bacterium]
MAGYRTHITCSSVAGAALGTWAHALCHETLSLSILSGCLCSLGGILPDIDSKNSTAFQRVMSLVSGFTALMLVSRLRDFPLTAEAVVIIGGLAFLLTWTFFGGAIKKLTRHRGMCHSIPMALIAAEIIFLLSSGSASDRLFKGIAIFLGVMVHLILDEFYSVQVTGTKGPYIKKSFGTALKIIDFDNLKATIVFFVILGFLTEAALNEPVWTESFARTQQEQIDLDKQKAMNVMRQTCPIQFELAVVEWVAENRLVLEPGRANNPKWAELEALFEGSHTVDDHGIPQGKGAPVGPTSPYYHSVSAPSGVSPASQSGLSFLDQINWNSRHAPEDAEPAPAEESTSEARPVSAKASPPSSSYEQGAALLKYIFR